MALCFKFLSPHSLASATKYPWLGGGGCFVVEDFALGEKWV